MVILDVITDVASVIAAIGISLGAVVALLAYRRQKNSSNEALAGVNQIPQNITPSSTALAKGVKFASLDFLCEGISLPTKWHKLMCRNFYEIGRLQFDAEPNNRNGIIEEARQKMAEIGSKICDAECKEAERFGIAISRSSGEEPENVERETGKLSAAAQLYAWHKAKEQETLLSLSRDLGKNIAITDYTEVKNRIADGAPLSEVIDDLPVLWQKIREIPWPQPETRIEPAKLVYVPVTKITGHEVLNDEKAVLDGEWIVSHKLGIVYPYV